MSLNKLMISIFLTFILQPLFAATDELAVLDDTSTGSPPNIGNFALPNPQQPGPLLSFGQTLIGRNFVQLYFSTFSPYHKITGPFRNLNASLTYGISDKTSFYFNYPIENDPKIRELRNTSLKDIDLQLEQSIYTKGNTKYQEQATLVGAITIPIQEGSVAKLHTSYGSPTYFLGATYNRTYVDWMVFFSPGALITTKSNAVRLGSQYLYQAGVGHNIFADPDKSQLFGLLEFYGQYTEKDEIGLSKIPNTGGNIISLTPSLSLATKTLMAKVGVGFPVIQELFGKQRKTAYFIASTVSYTLS